MFSEKGEFQATASVSMATEYNLQTAFAITNHLGIMANGMYANHNNTSQHHKSEQRFSEVALGYYLNKNKFYFDIWSGYGLGQANYVNPDGSKLDSVSGNFNRFFIQPGIGFKERNIHYGFVLRFSMLDFSNVTGVISDSPANYGNGNEWFYEPTLFYKYSYKKIFMTTQMGYSLNMTSHNPHVGYEPLQFSLGIGLRLSPKPKTN
jgi:hypothetical protein